MKKQGGERGELGTKSNPIRVTEVRPRWRSILAVSGLAVSLAGSGFTLYWTVFRDDAVQKATDEIAPISNAADRFNRGMERVDRFTEGFRRIRDRVIGGVCPNGVGDCTIGGEEPAYEYPSPAETNPDANSPTDTTDRSGWRIEHNQDGSWELIFPKN